MKKVFLGGTCNESIWRDELIEMLEIDYFNPVVDDWTEECYQEELRQREICDYCFTDMYEYEDILQRLYENSENKYNRSYATINDFADADLILSIENIEGAQVAKDFVEEIMSTR